MSSDRLSRVIREYREQSRAHDIYKYFYQEVPGMFGTNKEVKKDDAAAKVEYKITVEAARATKNDHIVMADLDVNGVKIKGCMVKEITVKQDGQKYKAGDTCYVMQFPSEKVGDKYYNKVWFPVSNKNMEDIISQVQSKLT